MFIIMIFLKDRAPLFLSEKLVTMDAHDSDPTDAASPPERVKKKRDVSLREM